MSRLSKSSIGLEADSMICLQVFFSLSISYVVPGGSPYFAAVASYILTKQWRSSLFILLAKFPSLFVHYSYYLIFGITFFLKLLWHTPQSRTFFSYSKRCGLVLRPVYSISAISFSNSVIEASSVKNSIICIFELKP